MAAIQNSTLPFPETIMMGILSHFSPQELSRSSRTNRSWYRLAFDPTLWNKFDIRKVFPQTVRVIDERVWAEYGDIKALEMSFDIPPLDNRGAIPELGGFFAKLKKQGVWIEKGAGVTILSLSQTMYSTQQELDAIAKNPKGTSLSIQWPDFWIPFQFGYRPRGYRIIISNGPLQAPWALDLRNQFLDCRNPSILEAVSLATLTFKSTNPPLRLFETSHIKCEEKTEFSYRDEIVQVNFFVSGIGRQKTLSIHPMIESPDRVAVCDFDGTWKDPLQI